VRGTSADFLKDAEGKPLGAAIVDAGSRQGGGSVRYMMINPTSGKGGAEDNVRAESGR
jgi:hypothetical protein